MAYPVSNCQDMFGTDRTFCQVLITVVTLKINYPWAMSKLMEAGHNKQHEHRSRRGWQACAERYPEKKVSELLFALKHTHRRRDER